VSVKRELTEWRDANKQVADRIIAEIEKGNGPMETGMESREMRRSAGAFQSGHKTRLSRYQRCDPGNEPAGIPDGRPRWLTFLNYVDAHFPCVPPAPLDRAYPGKRSGVPQVDLERETSFATIA
jgi:hypothetical protein